MTLLYMDTSALFKRYVEEHDSEAVLARIDEAPAVGTAVITRVEVAAALARAVRARRLDRNEAEDAEQEFLGDWDDFTRIGVTEALVERAGDLAWRHNNRLRRAAEKARQLASAPDRSAETDPFSGNWSASDGADDMLRVFDTLRLKAGFALRAFNVSGRRQRQRDHLGRAGRCAAGCRGRLSAARRHAVAAPAAAGGRPAHASNRGRRQSVVPSVGVDSEPRGCGIRGDLARLRLERPDHSLQAPAAGGRTGC